jgi:hypothetical protein
MVAPYEQSAPSVFLTSCSVEGGVPTEADGGDNIDLDPEFVDAPGLDFSLGPDSPARDIGITSFAWSCTGLNVDLSGGIGAGPDIGAIETP